MLCLDGDEGGEGETKIHLLHGAIGVRKAQWNTLRKPFNVLISNWFRSEWLITLFFWFGGLAVLLY